MWKKVKDFENYEVSDDGQVRSLNYNNTGIPKVLKTKTNKQGHLEVTLNKNNKHYYKMLSRLIIETFTINKLSRNDIIMYKDNDKTNCSLNNIYLITRGERQELTYDNDKRDIPKYEYYGEILSTKQISKKIGISSKTIRDRINRLYWDIYECEIPVGKPKIKDKKGEEV